MLIYLLNKTKLNTIFIIGQLSNQNLNSEIDYIKTINNVIYYPKSIIYLRLVYRAQTKDQREIKKPIISFLFRFIKYKDNNYTRNP